jgi:uncharacterized membrane protein
VAEGFVSDFKRFFLRGLAAVLPTLLTLMIIIYVVSFVHKYIGKYINIAVVLLVQFIVDLARQGPLPMTVADGIAQSYNRYFWWIGFLLAVVAIYIFGRFAASFIGRGIWRATEKSLQKVPIIRAIYPYVKQVTDFLFSDRKIEFSRVVAVEYPRKGVWSLGLVTGAGMRVLQNASRSDLLTVFVPSSPTPVTGYTITVRREEVIDLPMSIDDAIRYTVSGGVITPPGQQLSDAEIEQARQGVFLPLEQKETPR